MKSQKVRKAVTPAKAGVQNCLNELNSRLRGNDENEKKRAFYEIIVPNPEIWKLGIIWDLWFRNWDLIFVFSRRSLRALR